VKKLGNTPFIAIFDDWWENLAPHIPLHHKSDRPLSSWGVFLPLADWTLPKLHQIRELGMHQEMKADESLSEASHSSDTN